MREPTALSFRWKRQASNASASRPAVIIPIIRDARRPGCVYSGSGAESASSKFSVMP
jgi:hypothetical protein